MHSVLRWKSALAVAARCAVRWLASAVVLCVVLRSSPAAAQHAYDLDSLAHLSVHIIEGTLVPASFGSRPEVCEVEASVVHKGPLKVGERVFVPGVQRYRTTTIARDRVRTLAADDEVILFLRDEASRPAGLPKGTPVYAVLRGGIRLLDKRRVVPFISSGTPGTDLADPSRDTERYQSTPLDEFRKQIGESLARVPEFDRVVEAKGADFDKDRLLALFVERNLGEHPCDMDFYSDRAAGLIAATLDPQLIGWALSVAKVEPSPQVLSLGLGTPAGREYLFARIVDESLTVEERLRYAGALRWAGRNYSTSAAEARLDGKPFVDAGVENYLKRIATLARRSAKQEELCCKLVQTLNRVFSEPLTPDTLEAAKELQSLYRERPAAQVQFAIERALFPIRDEFDKLQSPGRDIVSILRPRTDLDKDGRFNGMISFKYDIRARAEAKDAKPFIVLENVVTGEKLPLEGAGYLKAQDVGGGLNMITRPSELKPGKYRAYLEYRRGDGVVSKGHGFEFEF